MLADFMPPITDEKDLLLIGDAAKLLDVSVNTLRRWDESGKLRSIRKTPEGNRYYRKEDLDFFPNDLFQGAMDWASAIAIDVLEIPSRIYCDTSSLFETRLEELQNSLLSMPNSAGILSLVVSITGEIGGNSFDHNLGQWPDRPGIFFAYHPSNREIVLADRGQGILNTLKKAKPDLVTHEEALKVAFTDFITGRTSEKRGNGLKYVKEVISKYPIGLRFQTGDTELTIEPKSPDLKISRALQPIRGCIAYIKF